MVEYDSIIITDENNRLFSAIVTAEVEDTQGEFVSVDKFKESFFKNKMKNKGEIPLIWNHSNLIVGAITDGEETDLEGVKAFKVYGYIYPSDPENDSYDTVWNGVKSGKATGLSIGGGRPILRDTINKAGKVIKELITIPLMEISLIFGTREDGSQMNPSNPLAKLVASSMAKSEDSTGEKVYIKSKSDAPVGAKIYEGGKGGLYFFKEPTNKTPKSKDSNSESDPEDIVSFNIPLITRLFEFALDSKLEDVDLHKLLERMIQASKEGTLTMDQYDAITNTESINSEVNKMEGNENTTPTAPDKLDIIVSMLQELISKLPVSEVEKEEEKPVAVESVVEPVVEPKEEVKKEESKDEDKKEEKEKEEPKEIEKMRKSVDALKLEIEGMKKTAIAQTPSVPSSVQAEGPKTMWEAKCQGKI